MFVFRFTLKIPHLKGMGLNLKFYPTLILLSLFCSCHIVEIDDYCHESTHEIRNSINHGKYSQIVGLSNAEIIIVPNFRTFSRSYSHFSGWIYILDKKQGQVYLKNVSLKTELKPEETVVMNKSVSLDQKLGDTQYFYTQLPVFDSDSFDIEAWNNQPVIFFSITYSVNCGKLKTKQFKLHHKTHKDIAWPT